MGWKIYLHDWAGEKIGEITDARNIQITTGLNKNNSMTFETTLLSPMGQQLADRDFSLVSAWRLNPYTNQEKIMFAGSVFTTEENGEDNIPTIAVAAVGPFWNLGRRIANDSNNRGRTQEGISPTPSSYYLFIADSDNDRIAIFNANNGSYIANFGSTGSGNGQFSNPTGVSVSPDNKFLYVADMGNDRVQKFSISIGSPYLTYVTKWGTTGSGDAQFDEPFDVAADNRGDIWVSDIGNNRVVKYTNTGTFLAKFRPVNSSNVARMDPRGISADRDGIIWIGDGSNTFGTESWWKIDGTTNAISSFSFIQTHREVIRDSLNNYYFIQGTGDLWKNSTSGTSIKTKIHEGGANENGRGLVLSDDNQMFISVADNANSTGHVRVYDSSGLEVRRIGSYGTGAGNLKNPRGLALARPGVKDAITIVNELISQANTENQGFILASPSGTSSPVYIKPGSWGGFKKISEIIEELSANFEWKIDPAFSKLPNIPPNLGTWTADAVLGSNKSSSIIFEYGTGRHNADRYSIKKSIEGLATKVSYPAAENTPYVVSVSSNNLGEVGLFEDVQSGNIISPHLRRQVATTALRFRHQPRVLVEITPARSDQTTAENSRTPIPLIDYDLGDIVGLEIFENGLQRLSGVEARIYDITIAVDENGKENATINLYFD